MDFEATLQELQSLGTEQNRKTYRRHGVGEPMYGVSWANLKLLRKRLKVNHTLACALWETGNHDARILATMIADPKAMDEATLETWAKGLSNYVIVGAFVELVGTTPFARRKMEAWRNEDTEGKGCAAWSLLGTLAMNDPTLTDADFEPYLAEIERDIHARKNRVRHAMNSALIAIGIRNEALQKRALEVAKAIGKVSVDHGDTSCKTPDAAEYIHRTLAHRQKAGSAASRA